MNIFGHLRLVQPGLITVKDRKTNIRSSPAEAIKPLYRLLALRAVAASSAQLGYPTLAEMKVKWQRKER